MCSLQSKFQAERSNPQRTPGSSLWGTVQLICQMTLHWQAMGELSDSANVTEYWFLRCSQFPPGFPKFSQVFPGFASQDSRATADRLWALCIDAQRLRQQWFLNWHMPWFEPSGQLDAAETPINFKNSKDYNRQSFRVCQNLKTLGF